MYHVDNHQDLLSIAEKVNIQDFPLRLVRLSYLTTSGKGGMSVTWIVNETLRPAEYTELSFVDVSLST